MHSKSHIHPLRINEVIIQLLNIENKNACIDNLVANERFEGEAQKYSIILTFLQKGYKT